MTTTTSKPARRTPRDLKEPVTTAVSHLSVAERVARGKAARVEVPRSSHAVFEPPATRVDPVELLERQAATRVPELVPVRYGRMLISPFMFYRGAAMIMAHDLDRAILEFSKAYAEQNERDYNALAEAVKSGRIAAQTGL